MKINISKQELIVFSKSESSVYLLISSVLQYHIHALVKVTLIDLVTLSQEIIFESPLL